MAERKVRDLGPHYSNADSDDIPRSPLLTETQVDNFVRMLVLSSPEVTAGLCVTMEKKLEELGVDPDPTKAVAGLPEGSTTFNVRLLLDWIKLISPQHVDCIDQLLTLQATAHRANPNHRS